MRVLVVAASKYGATDEIADAIGRGLTDRGLMTTVKKPGEVDSIDAYGAVVLGSAVYAGHWMSPAKRTGQSLPRVALGATGMAILQRSRRGSTEAPGRPDRRLRYRGGHACPGPPCIRREIVQGQAEPRRQGHRESLRCSRWRFPRLGRDPAMDISDRGCTLRRPAVGVDRATEVARSHQRVLNYRSILRTSPPPGQTPQLVTRASPPRVNAKLVGKKRSLNRTVFEPSRFTRRSAPKGVPVVAKLL